MAERNDLLPPNRSPLERATARALADIERVPIPLRTLWNPYTCPEHLLPYLAWAFSVEHWRPEWPTERKRRAIAESWLVHRKKGTHAAVRRVVELLGHEIESVTEWWQVTPNEHPATWWMTVAAQGIDEKGYFELVRLIDDARPVTRHLTGLNILTTVRGVMYVAASAQGADTTTIYPGMPDIDATVIAYTAIGLDVTDTTTVYPKP